jgi:trimeric autotransporter adhesin
MHTLQYGLIAEEVAKIYPEMVGYDKDGQPASVKYQALAPMLLNEVQKQNVQLLNQQGENRRLEEQLAELQAQLSSLAATVARPASSQ